MSQKPKSSFETPVDADVIEIDRGEDERVRALYERPPEDEEPPSRDDGGP